MPTSASRKLEGEAGLVVRDSLRAARHVVTVGCQLVARAAPNRMGSLELGERVDRLAESANGAASRLAYAAFELVEPRNSIRLPCATDILLKTADVSGVNFAHAGYKTLRKALKLIGVENALVMETRIESAFAAAKSEACQREMSPLAFAAALTWQLLECSVIVNFAPYTWSAQGQSRKPDAAATTACIAVGLAIAAASCQAVEAEDGDGLLASACTMVSALKDEVAAILGPHDIERLFTTYAGHV